MQSATHVMNENEISAKEIEANRILNINIENYPRAENKDYNVKPAKH